eukprot:jgi/Botrbrau1/3955/Bobra.0365s0029.2
MVTEMLGNPARDACLINSCRIVGRRAPFTPHKRTNRSASASHVVQCRAGEDLSRRSTLGAAAASVLLAAVPGTALAKPPKGFLELKDSQDGYDFYYPFGWQEVAVNGQDVVYKDIIEPLESVSVSLTATDKLDVTEFGPPEEVAVTLATGVLTPPNQEVKVLDVAQVGPFTPCAENDEFAISRTVGNDDVLC